MGKIYNKIMETVLSRKLRGQARQRGACVKYLDKWEPMDGIDGMLELYRKPASQEFCHNTCWPDYKVLLDNAGIERLERHGIYLNSSGFLDYPESGYYVLLGASRVVLRPGDFKAYHFFVRDDSVLTVETSQSNTAKLIFEKSERGRVDILYNHI